MNLRYRLYLFVTRTLIHVRHKILPKINKLLGTNLDIETMYPQILTLRIRYPTYKNN